MVLDIISFLLNMVALKFAQYYDISEKFFIVVWRGKKKDALPVLS